MIATASIGQIILSVDASPAIRVVDPGVPLADHWTAQQVAQFPDRLVAFCSFNPLADYALDELDRCKASGRFTGVKLHFGTSEVDLRNPDHVKKVRAVVQAANRSRMPIVVHVRADANYGRIEAEIMLNDVIAAAPDVPLQIAHLCGGEQYSDAALRVYADAVAKGDPRTTNLYFDLAEVALAAGNSPETLQSIAIDRPTNCEASRAMSRRTCADRFASLQRASTFSASLSGQDPGQCAGAALPLILIVVVEENVRRVRFGGQIFDCTAKLGQLLLAVVVIEALR